MSLAELIAQGHNVAVLGQGGTGKSTLCLQVLRSLTGSKEVVRTGASGVAACTINGRTIHSFAGIKDGRCGTHRPSLESMLSAERAADIRKTSLLFIDEISMVSSRLLEQVDIICQIAKACSKPFGGLQVLVCGDFYQLPPVEDQYTGDNGDYAFNSKSWKQLKLKYIHLTEVHRCADERLSRCVNQLSKGISSPEARAFIASLLAKPKPSYVDATTLCGTNEECDTINTECLMKMSGECKSYEATDAGIPKLLDRLAPRLLSVKVGAKVILTANISIKSGLVNGSSGRVVNFGKDSVTVCFSGKEQQPCQIHPFRFSSPSGSRLQIPLRLAWARTVHRAQSMTLEGQVHVVFSKMTQPGQLAVALSRVRDAHDLSASGAFHPPPERGEVTAFYYMIEDGSNPEDFESSSDEEDADVTEEESVLPARQHTFHQEVQGFIYPGEDINEKIMWDGLANFWLQANQSSTASSKQKAYANLVEAYMYGPQYESIVQRIGRVEAFTMWEAVRRKFADHYRKEAPEPPLQSTSKTIDKVIDPGVAEANEEVNEAKLRKMAGLTLHRCRQTIRKKVQFFTRHSKMELTEKYISMRGILNDRLVAERETVFEEPSSREIEFFQNQSFALTNVTSDFLLFFKKLSERLFNLLRANKHSKTVISSAKSQLAEDTQLMTDFTERFIRSDSEQNIMKELYLMIADQVSDTGSYEFRRNAIERCSKKRTLREEVRAATKKKKNTSTSNDVCCVCKKSDDQTSAGTPWIQCTKCHRWIHQDCLSATPEDLQQFVQSEDWKCFICETMEGEEGSDSD